MGAADSENRPPIKIFVKRNTIVTEKNNMYTQVITVLAWSWQVSRSYESCPSFGCRSGGVWAHNELVIASGLVPFVKRAEILT
jgi:hypothetical protein